MNTNCLATQHKDRSRVFRHRRRLRYWHGHSARRGWAGMVRTARGRIIPKRDSRARLCTPYDTVLVTCEPVQHDGCGGVYRGAEHRAHRLARRANQAARLRGCVLDSPWSCQKTDCAKELISRAIPTPSGAWVHRGKNLTFVFTEIMHDVRIPPHR